MSGAMLESAPPALRDGDRTTSSVRYVTISRLVFTFSEETREYKRSNEQRSDSASRPRNSVLSHHARFGTSDHPCRISSVFTFSAMSSSGASPYRDKRDST